jgi:hypothetical protein
MDIPRVRSSGAEVQAIQKELEEDLDLHRSRYGGRDARELLNLHTPRLLRYRKSPNLQVFLEEFRTKSPTVMQQEWPILSLFVELLETLQAQRNMFLVCKWLRLVHKRFNKKISREEAEAKTVHDILARCATSQLFAHWSWDSKDL